MLFNGKKLWFMNLTECDHSPQQFAESAETENGEKCYYIPSNDKSVEDVAFWFRIVRQTRM